jgi:hypothetical protein
LREQLGKLPEPPGHVEMLKSIKRWHVFGDHALLRRALIGWRLMQRNQDGTDYRRIEQKPPAELQPLLARLRL